MARRNVERLKEYLSIITRKRGGIEAMVESVSKGEEAVLESAADAGTTPAFGGSVEARRGLETLARGAEPSEAQYDALEAIIDADLRPAIDVVDGTFKVTHPLWTRLSDDAAIRKRIEAVIPSVGRIELPGHPRLPYGGTGFVVGNGLVMTNRHVAEIFARGLGDRRIEFLAGARAGIDFVREQGRPPGETLAVRKVVMIHPYWDVALLAVDGLPSMRPTLKLSLKDARDLVGHDIFVIGYPAFDPRNPAAEQDGLFDGRYGVKRLQPGELQGGMEAASFGKLVRSATHDCSTLGGNSGSAVVDLDSGEVLGLHFGGLYHRQNYAVPAFELGRDSRVVDAGVAFAGAAPGGANDWASWWSRADATEGPAYAETDARPPADDTSAPAPRPATPTVSVPGSGGAVSIEVPLRITISLSAPAATAAERREAVAAERGAEDLVEGLREPDHDTDYASRGGYDPGFLDPGGGAGAVAVPLPEAKDRKVLAKSKAGGDVLDYEHFSVRMHAKRRLALVTASNVTKAPPLRKPEPGRDYTRKGLTGLGKNDQERWFVDPRLGEQLQLPDVFFTKDRGAFDKGHIVRRDDVAWGATYEELRRANGDTFHVTNCSPQVADFNRSADGKDNWGDLENHVLSEAASERLCVFAGPVLDPADEVFVGVGKGGATLRAKIPSRFWKVIVARVADGVAAYGFVLEQDLSRVEYEFVVPSEFAPAMTPLEDIEAMTGVVFDRRVREADQYETVRGAEILMRSGVRRRPRSG